MSSPPLTISLDKGYKTDNIVLQASIPGISDPHEVVRKLNNGYLELRDGSKVTEYELDRLKNIERNKILTRPTFDAVQQAAAALIPRSKIASRTRADPGASTSSVAPQRKMPARAVKEARTR